MPIRVPKFCVSLLPRNEQELKTQLIECNDADLIEIRLDRITRLDLNSIKSYLNKPVIAAVRTEDEGGFFSGSLSELNKIYQRAIHAGVDYIDISYQNSVEVLSQLNLNEATEVILSSHTNEKGIESLKKHLHVMSSMRADVYKLVFTAESLSDNIAALNLIDSARDLGIPFVIHAQGERGKLSRILGGLRGNEWTYLSLDEDRKTAPGQLSISSANQFYLKEKNSDTRIFGLVGYPVDQSRGWILHNRVFHQSKINAIYLNFPAENVEEFWRYWHDKIDGLSVTIPHKENILTFINNKSKEAEASGVCNTLLKRGESWEAHNTDLLAIIELLQSYRERLSSVLVYGTGATACSAIAALQQIEAQEIFLAGRNKQRGKYLAEQFSIKFLNSGRAAPNLSAIIQTTPVGMYPKVNALPYCAVFLGEGMLVLDVVHNPPATKFLQLAEEIGCTTISGEEMFLHQAALQYKLFTGKPMSIDKIKEIWNELF